MMLSLVGNMLCVLLIYEPMDVKVTWSNFLIYLEMVSGLYTPFSSFSFCEDKKMQFE